MLLSRTHSMVADTNNINPIDSDYHTHLPEQADAPSCSQRSACPRAGPVLRVARQRPQLRRRQAAHPPIHVGSALAPVCVGARALSGAAPRPVAASWACARARARPRARARARARAGASIFARASTVARAVSHCGEQRAVRGRVEANGAQVRVAQGESPTDSKPFLVLCIVKDVEGRVA